MSVSSSSAPMRRQDRFVFITWCGRVSDTTSPQPTDSPCVGDVVSGRRDPQVLHARQRQAAGPLLYAGLW
jgi:hypothetical protein